MQNTIVLDLETANSAQDCLYCGQPEDAHDPLAGGLLCPRRHGGNGEKFTSIGWHNKVALGLSIGCYWDYADARIHWFDTHTVERAVVQEVVDRQALLVSFNGIGFDFPLMVGLLRRHAITLPKEIGVALLKLCAEFETLCEASYDILAEIWKLDEQSKYARGVNSLDAIAQANGLGAKLSNGALAPRDWAAGRYADVLNYCQDDTLKTKDLFELVLRGQPILRNVPPPMDKILLPRKGAAHA
jgi:hypothetical protein